MPGSCEEGEQTKRELLIGLHTGFSFNLLQRVKGENECNLVDLHLTLSGEPHWCNAPLGKLDGVLIVASGFEIIAISLAAWVDIAISKESCSRIELLAPRALRIERTPPRLRRNEQQI